jgi:DNA replication protein DnaD
MDLTWADLDWRKLLVKHYKYYGLDERGLAAVLAVDDILSSLTCLITADDLVSYMTLPKEEIDKILAELLEKKYLAYVNENGKMVTSLAPLKDKIVSDLKKDIVIESNEGAKKQGQEQVNTLYSYFEETIGRPLTGREVDRITTWVRSGASEGQIKEAVEKLRAQNRAVSLAAVDKILLAIQKSADISKDGWSVKSGDYRETNQETVDILAKNWIPGKDK